MLCLFDRSDCNFHSKLGAGSSLDNSPTILSGGGAGIKFGSQIMPQKDTPLCSVWQTKIRNISIRGKRHGERSGVMQELIA